MGDKGKNHFDFGALRALGLITQAGLSFCVPLVLCILGASYLRSRFGLGQWIMLIGIFLGLASGASGFANVLRAMDRLSQTAPASPESQRALPHAADGSRRGGAGGVLSDRSL